MVDKAGLDRQKPKAPQDQCGAGGSDSVIEVTPEMIEAGVDQYEVWEPEHIFDDQGGAADYAKRELVAAVYRAMASMAKCSSERESQ